MLDRLGRLQGETPEHLHQPSQYTIFDKMAIQGGNTQTQQPLLRGRQFNLGFSPSLGEASFLSSLALIPAAMSSSVNRTTLFVAASSLENNFDCE
ncbi:hypothetical protein RHSIM_Rhsim02G0135900 [Rhododendron simsii]|uniref:Uncharacterized protein n=1 Tax=Rhododendron simsii TaxID=118357 RepID=A0A834HA65_RHOSS|nr:hypothetical protein RHSIM_Rhsim02G0135900 [Rhododendron simsii]